MTAIATSSLATPASALDLDWNAPEHCPPAQDISRDIARLAGPNQGQSLRAQVVITHPEGQRWRVVIDMSGSATGHRELTADNCAQLANAAALIIALAANPDAALDLPTEEARQLTATGDNPPEQPATAADSQAPRAQPTVAPAPSPPPEPEPAIAPKQQIAPELLAAIGYDWGSLPHGAALLRLGAALRYAWLYSSLSLDATETEATEFIGGYGAEFRAIGGQWFGCLAPESTPLRAMLCLGPRLELLQVAGYGNTVNRDNRVWRPGAVGALSLAYPVGRHLLLGLAAEALVQLSRPKFVIENVDSKLYESSRYALRTLAQASWRF